MPCIFSDDDLDRLFPAFIKTDFQGQIQSAGPSLMKHAGDQIIGQDLLDSFEVNRPLSLETIKGLLQHQQFCCFALRANPALKLQGTVHKTETGFYLLLGHIPNLDDTPDAPQYRFSDFAPFDGSKDMLLSAQIRKGLLTDVQDLVEGLKRGKVDAEAADAAKGEFLACMSHEIRTPLNGVLGLASLLQATELTPKQSNMVQSLRTCGIDLLDQLNDIIDIARMDAGQIEILPEVVDLSEISKTLSDRFALTADKKGLRFDVTMSPGLIGVSLLADPFRLSQILTNLVSNALKFTHDGGVLIAFGVQGSDLETQLSIDVHDTGIGIADDDLNRIFNAFTQADSGITRKFGGTGLGLNICKRLIDKMNGSLHVQSEIGAGSIFSIRLPLRRAEQAPSDILRSA